MFQFKKWIFQKIKTRRAIALCHKVYRDVPGFSLAKQARQVQQQFSYEYIYGEIDFKSFAHLLSRCKIMPTTVFYDLGSGTGKALVCAALLYDFKKICGIENLQLLHECAQNIINKIPAQNIFLYHADLLVWNIFDSDLVFINASAFIGDFWEQVLARLIQLKEGTQVIVVSKRLPGEYFTQLYEDFLPMSFGLARVGIYRR